MISVGSKNQLYFRRLRPVWVIIEQNIAGDSDLRLSVGPEQVTGAPEFFRYKPWEKARVE